MHFEKFMYKWVVQCTYNGDFIVKFCINCNCNFTLTPSEIDGKLFVSEPFHTLSNSLKYISRTKILQVRVVYIQNQ